MSSNRWGWGDIGDIGDIRELTSRYWRVTLHILQYLLVSDSFVYCDTHDTHCEVCEHLVLPKAVYVHCILIIVQNVLIHES